MTKTAPQRPRQEVAACTSTPQGVTGTGACAGEADPTSLIGLSRAVTKRTRP